MSLLREIQAALMQGQDIGPILLKLRFLASRLGSDVLEEWVKHESEGYPEDVGVPDYRKIGISFKGTFFGSFGSGLENVPIPNYLVEKFGGKRWTTYEMRQSVAGVDKLVSAMDTDSAGTLQINASNLILLLQGKVYKDYACNDVTGTIPMSAMHEIQNAVRTRVLELTIQLEKSIPATADISLGPAPALPAPKDMEKVTQITQQIVHGNVTTITTSGDQAHIHVGNVEGDSSSLIKTLVDAGIADNDAQELAQIVASESGGTKVEPFGTKAKAWFAKNISKATDGTWKVGIAVATKVLSEAALKYYGFK